jgi:hypothetical protein
MRLNFNTCHIFLLNIYYEYENGSLSLDNFEKILQYLESYFVRRFFVGVSTKTLGSIFNSLYKEVKAKDPDSLVNGLREVLRGYEKTKIWTTDDDFRAGILKKTVYSNGDRDRVKLILESLENFYSKKEKVEPQKLNIEHIMPQTLTLEWKKTLGTNFNNVHKQYLHTLANLTLTGYNPELSNKPFDEKKSIYTESNISLNRYFNKIETWNADTIQKRAEYLADIAVQIWTR